MRLFKLTLTTKILMGMLLGLLIGILLKQFPHTPWINIYLIDGLFDTGGKIFFALLQMMIVPIVFVSLTCGICSLGDASKLGQLSLKTLTIFISVTVVAVIIALFCAHIFPLGYNIQLQNTADLSAFKATSTLSWKSIILNLVPTNPLQALVSGNIIQIIVFAIFIGVAILLSDKTAKRWIELFQEMNIILMKLIMIIMQFAPYGVCFLMAEVFAKTGFNLIWDLVFYILAILLALLIQLFVVYGALLFFVARLNPLHFFKKAYPIMLFAFGTASSNATIPINLEVTEHQLGVPGSIASFVIPLGATLFKCGTAIMQAIAIVFIANAYHVPLSGHHYWMIVFMVTLTSITTAGVPNIGITTLAIILEQLGLPLAGIGLIIGIDRIIDMARTTINVTGNTMAACLIAKTQKMLDKKQYASAAEPLS